MASELARGSEKPRAGAPTGQRRGWVCQRRGSHLHLQFSHVFMVFPTLSLSFSHTVLKYCHWHVLEFGPEAPFLTARRPGSPPDSLCPWRRDPRPPVSRCRGLRRPWEGRRRTAEPAGRLAQASPPGTVAFARCRGPRGCPQGLRGQAVVQRVARLCLKIPSHHCGDLFFF